MTGPLFNAFKFNINHLSWILNGWGHLGWAVSILRWHEGSIFESARFISLSCSFVHVTYQGSPPAPSPPPWRRCQADLRILANTPAAPGQYYGVKISRFVKKNQLSPCGKLTPSPRSCHSDSQRAWCWEALKWERLGVMRRENNHLSS